MQQDKVDITMEKKPNTRAFHTFGKTTTPDSKLRQDAVAYASGHSKFNRVEGLHGGRKWEGQTSKNDSFSNKQWPNKKSSPQHKSYFVPENGARNRNQVALVEEAEIGSAARPGSKKLNLNHLLNFNYEARGVTGGRHASSFQGHRNNRSVWTTRVHKYNKEQFLQANCQFVVQDGQDYSVYSADPDLLVDWDKIEQVRVFSHELPSCPICLFPPVAAKMTRCGHLYCWPCILHYLALSDKTWRKCPICYEAVSKTHLKSVVAQTTPCYNVGDEITMVLMQRFRGSVIAVPRSAAKKSYDRPLKMKPGENSCFAKLVIATNDQVIREIINIEEMELDTAFEENKNCPEVCFIEDAILQLKERKQKLLLKEKTEEPKLQFNDLNTVSDSDNLNIINYSSAFNEEETEVQDCKDNEEHVNLTEDLVSGEKSNDGGLSAMGKDYYYFYQSDDGQHIYMHGLNAHMLTREYGNLENCPDKVVAVIVEKEYISMNEDIRKRLRYLAHLPLTCDFEVVELKFGQPLVSEETLQAFSEEINNRKKKRSQRVREENKRDRQLKAKEDRKMGNVAAAKISLGSLAQFPECGPFNSSIQDQVLAIPILCTSSSLSSEDGQSPPIGPSFAQMLKDGKGKMKADMNVVSLGAMGGGVANDSDSDDERTTVPTYKDSFSAALRDALDNYSVVNSNEGESRGKQKKKGKQNKTLLFANNVIRKK